MLAIFEEENPTKFSRIDPVSTNPTTTSLSCSKQAEQFASYLQTPNNSEVFFIDKKVQNSCSHICNRSFGIFLHWVLFRIQPFMGLLKCKNCHWFYFAFAFCLVSQSSTQELCFFAGPGNEGMSREQIFVEQATGATHWMRSKQTLPAYAPMIHLCRRTIICIGPNPYERLF